MIPRIDILLAAYNGESFISDQIHSILNQTHKNIRLIIRDDASTDGTKAVVESFCRQFPEKIILETAVQDDKVMQDFELESLPKGVDHSQTVKATPIGSDYSSKDCVNLSSSTAVSRIILMPSNKNLGIKGNFSALMEHADADYIMFSDQDDVWLPEKAAKTLEKMKEMEQQHGSLVPLLVHTDLVVTDKKLQPIHPSYWHLSRLKPGLCKSLNRMLVQNNVTGCTMMVNRHLLNLALPIPNECIMHDWWLALVAAAFGAIGTVNECTMLYRQHGSNAIGAHINKSFWEKLKDSDIIAWGITGHQKNKILQANVFYQTYEKRLSRDQKDLLEAYIQWQKHPHLKKRYLLVKHGFFKNDPLKNLLRITFNIGL